MIKKNIRLGMVGGGEGSFIGEIHRLAARLDGQIDLVAGAFSQDHENTLRTGATLGIDASRCYKSYTEMMAQEATLPADERIEFVSIVTPNHLHVPVSIAALEAGFHVLCDKPAAMSLFEARKLEEVIKASGRLYGLTHTYLGYPLVWQMQAIVAAGEIGAVTAVNVHYLQGWLSQREEEKNRQAAWRTDPSKAGIAGCMGDIGTHAQSLAEFVVGQQITRVSAVLGTHVEGRALDDNGAAVFEMTGGAKGTLTASQVHTGMANDLTITVAGELGTLSWKQGTPNMITLQTPAGMRTLFAGTDQSYLHPNALSRCRTPAEHPEGYIEAFANLYKDFAVAIRRQEKGKATGVPGIETGLSSMAFLEAMVAGSISDEKWTALENTSAGYKK